MSSCCFKEPSYPTPYEFEFDLNAKYIKNNRFCSNFVKTTKYTLLTFFPKSLLFQFRHIANVYFLIIAILLSIPIISPISSLTAWTPLIFVLLLSIIREGYEDFQRYKEDQKLNYNSIATVIRNGKPLELPWSEIGVGEICFVKADELFPADLFLLSSSSEEGSAFIETASLDGEKNLKYRVAFQDTNRFRNVETIKKLSGRFLSGFPDKNLEEFKCKILLTDEKEINVTNTKQFLFRGSRLKNTKWIYGLVIYTGLNSKVMLNLGLENNKMSQIDSKVNKFLIWLFVFQLIICFICAIGYGLLRMNNEENWFYVSWPARSVFEDSLIMFFTYLVLLNNLIPISLIVTIEMVKTVQKYFINKDFLMYSSLRNEYSQGRTSSLNEELGQIEYVFTDKTGTLTANIMEFKIALIGNTIFGDRDLLSGLPPKQKGFFDPFIQQLLAESSSNVILETPIYIKNLEGKVCKTITHLKELTEEYFLLLSVTHEVVVAEKLEGETTYEGPSPDEIALVNTAKLMGFEFINSTMSKLIVKIRSEEVVFDKLEIIPFTSKRKKMSIMLRDPRDGLIKLYSKGADSFMAERLASNQAYNVDEYLHMFSVQGLRTLVVAMRVVSEKEYAAYMKEYKRISLDKNEEAIEKLHESLENNFFLLGATAVLDRLQESVPEVIRDLIRANIKVWMLTGDKMETAENIAKSCKLIQDDFCILRLSSIVEEHSYKNHIEIELEKLIFEAKNLNLKKNKKALLIETTQITEIMLAEKTEISFMELTEMCETVVCCRLLPSQKAEIVSLVRRRLNKITLAIGDGANDVPMIKTAHIGIGLFGEEGAAAVQNSDYALPEFKMLWRLLFIHGRWNYIRISEMVLYFFYKNVLFATPQFIAAIYCAFSGQTIFEQVYLSLYNILFTSLPIFFRTILEQDINYMFKEKYFTNKENIEIIPIHRHQELNEFKPNKYMYRLIPKLYFIGQSNCIINFKNFTYWFVEALLEASLTSAFCFQIIGQESLNESGISSNYTIVGLTIYTTIIFLVTFKLATHTRYWSFCLAFVIFLTSILFYALFFVASNYFLFAESYNVVIITLQTADFYFIVLFCICFILILDGVIVYIDFIRDSYASRMRIIEDKEMIEEKKAYSENLLTITEGLSNRALEEEGYFCSKN